MFDLTGKVALVTGAGQGIGRGIVQALAGQGAAVAVNDLYAERADATLHTLPAATRSLSVSADVTDLGAVIEMVSITERELGPVDIFVSNAGIPAVGFAVTKFRDMDPSDWDKYIRLNVYGFLNGCKAVIDGMCERRWGRIIAIASEGGRMGGDGMGISIYGAAKAGVVGFVRNLSQEVGEFGVTVNAVSPGVIAPEGGAVRDALFAKYPIKRAGRPSDIAAAVTYLASAEAEWITGQQIPVNGGGAPS